MGFHVFPLSQILSCSNKHKVIGRPLIVLLGTLVITPSIEAQTSIEPNSSQQTTQMLLEKIDRLQSELERVQARVTQLETAQSGKVANSPPTQEEANRPAADQAPEPSESNELEKMDVSKTLLNIRGFGDVGLYGGNQKGQTTSFSLGELDLFITSHMSEKFKFLTELVFEVHKNNEFEEDLERVLLEYSYNDYLQIAAGRFHTDIGYYNTAYHHTTWFQTTTNRPFLFQFEDEGGILPIHNVGVSASGQIPSGRLGLHYVAEVANGRASSSPQAQPVQNRVDENNRKAVNLAIFARPEAVPGLQLGFSAYRDVLYPIGKSRIGETIFDAYAVLSRSNFEWLNETLLIRHAPQDSRAYNTAGFYTQISKRLGAYRPYFRYQYVNASDTEPVFPQVGLQTGPSVGVRYDANDSVAVKLQYDYTELRRQPGISALGLQVGFTF